MVADTRAQIGTCPAGSAGCVSPSADNCTERGFDTARLNCKTCRMLEKRLKETGVDVAVVGECLACCKENAEVEKFPTARLIADASQQERDQDLHDFIKRKAPRYKGLEVEYMEGAEPAIELESETDPDRIIRAVVSGWKSDHLGAFLGARLEGADQVTMAQEQPKDEGEVKMAAAGAWTAEVQSCSG